MCRLCWNNALDFCKDNCTVLLYLFFTETGTLLVSGSLLKLVLEYGQNQEYTDGVEMNRAVSSNTSEPPEQPEGRNTSSIFESIVTRDRKMWSIFRYIEAIAPTSQAVLITGETGTGKELIARALHAVSRYSGDFVSVNVAGLDDMMFSDTLFGHNRGAYTGADRTRKGLIETAAGGTLFLDEIGELNKASQVKLLRLLQEHEYYSLGSDRKMYSTARILVATNTRLDALMESGSFRSDLYYRLCSHHIHLPSLRERRDDIPLLVEYFTAKAAKDLGRPLPKIPEDMLDLLLLRNFPGNVRELKGLVINAVAVSDNGTVVFPRSNSPRPALAANNQITADFNNLPHPAGRMPTLFEAEEYLIREALKVSGGNQRAAALLLGISRQALNKRIKRDLRYLEKQS